MDQETTLQGRSVSFLGSKVTSVEPHGRTLEVCAGLIFCCTADVFLERLR